MRVVLFIERGTVTIRSRRLNNANWLAGCLLLPREALLWILQQRLEPEAAARIPCN
jgi:hypothetical protein